jgi:hypothetical protein
MTYQLRDYQSDLLDRIDKAWFSGHRSLLCQLPTGGGKSIIFATVVHQAIKSGSKCLILAHREELIKQAADKVEIITNEPVGIIKAGYPTNYDRDIQVASVQSLTRRLKYCPEFDLIVVDECFPAGTPVDGKPIESLKVNDLVSSFNESTGRIELKPIVRLFCKLSDKAIFVNVGGKRIECTPEHPFYTKRGWIPASKLTTEDYLYVRQLPDLPINIQTSNSANSHCTRGESCVLFDGVSKGLYKNSEGRTTCPLQNRYSQSHHDDSDRNRWKFPLCGIQTAAGREETGSLNWVRVDGVEVPQQASDGGSTVRNVYNIEVLGNHNYFVDGILVHNCHHSTSTSYRTILNRFPNARVLGVTATASNNLSKSTHEEQH